MATAGPAVVFSGAAVATGLAMLLFMPLPFMRGFGVGGLLTPAVSLLAAVTFLPVMLSLSDRAWTAFACYRGAGSTIATTPIAASGQSLLLTFGLSTMVMTTALPLAACRHSHPAPRSEPHRAAASPPSDRERPPPCGLCVRSS
jgi:uncharacterized membrane protein YdfJ with MMPL/SSD domain